VLASAVVFAPAARADDAFAPPATLRQAPTEPPQVPFRAGLGWHTGNGVGGPLALGAGVLLRDRVGFELQLGYTKDEMTTYGIGSLARVYLLRRERVTPFLAAGFVLRRATLDSLGVTQLGVFANAGPEWRWPSGLRILLGAGVVFAPAARDSNSSASLEGEGGARLNLELGVRYLFI
jgi:opacity protein-like surface antigen